VGEEVDYALGRKFSFGILSNLGVVDSHMEWIYIGAGLRCLGGQVSDMHGFSLSDGSDIGCHGGVFTWMTTVMMRREREMERVGVVLVYNLPLVTNQ
jgi:hypothetical protein